MSFWLVFFINAAFSSDSDLTFAVLHQCFYQIKFEPVLHTTLNFLELTRIQAEASRQVEVRGKLDHPFYNSTPRL